MEQHPHHIIVASCLVRDEQQRLLLVKHHRRGWELPQGRVEEGEGLLPALHREVSEETGVSMTNARLAAVWSKCSPPAALILGFVADFAAGALRPSAETLEVAWFPTKEAIDKVAHPVNRERLRVLLEDSGAIRYFSYTTSPYRLERDG